MLRRPLGMQVRHKRQSSSPGSMHQRYSRKFQADHDIVCKSVELTEYML